MSENGGNAEHALEALPGVAASAGVTKYAPASETLAKQEMQDGAIAGAQLLFFGGPGYPKALYDLPDPPPLLWAKGDASLTQGPVIALVGARNASSLGLRMAKALAKRLGAFGVTVASGLARGVDAAAHEAALSTGTVAVVAGGVDVVYPQENAALTDEIGKRGLILSERPIGLRPQARDFPRRNRLIAGISRGVVVVEAAEKSGSLRTARDGLDQGREVMAVPGHPLDARAAGCNLLIREGARLVRSAEDIFEALGPDFVRTGMPGASLPDLPGPPPRVDAEPMPRPADRLDVRILSLLSESPIGEDQLARDCAVSGPALSAALSDLELSGAVIRRPGGLISKAS